MLLYFNANFIYIIQIVADCIALVANNQFHPVLMLMQHLICAVFLSVSTLYTHIKTHYDLSDTLSRFNFTAGFNGKHLLRVFIWDLLAEPSGDPCPVL